MDPLTHAISGIALARALPKQSLPRRQIILLAGLAMLPDADYILTFISDTLYLQYHRGITHSILMLPLWTWLIYALSGRTRSAIPAWLIATAIALHIGLDLITSFGTMVLAPFSDWRAALDLVFIIDPLFTACLLIPLLLTMIWKRHARILACTSLALALGYILLTAYNHEKAIALVKSHTGWQGKVEALPLPFSPFHWQIIVDSSDTYYNRAFIDVAPDMPDMRQLFPDALTHSFVQPESIQTIHWQTFTKMNVYNSRGSKVEGLDFYRWFARYPVVLHRMNRNTLDFGDLRFGIERRETNWPFRFQAEFGKTTRSWLVWRGNRRSQLP